MRDMRLVKYTTTASTNATLVQAGNTQLFGWIISNSGAGSGRGVKVYNKGTAAPIPGTDTPVLNIAVPATAGNSNITQLLDNPINLTLGLGFATTIEIHDGGNTAIAANDLVVHFLIG